MALVQAHKTIVVFVDEQIVADCFAVGFGLKFVCVTAVGCVVGDVYITQTHSCQCGRTVFFQYEIKGGFHKDGGVRGAVGDGGIGTRGQMTEMQRFMIGIIIVGFLWIGMLMCISELFLLGLFLLMKENERLRNAIALRTVDCVEQPSEEAVAQKDAVTATVDVLLDQVDMEQYQLGIQKLTATEHAVFELYISGRGTKEIMSELNIKENTLKFHNKNIYGKLGVSSRKQLIAAYKYLHSCE